MRQRQMDVEKQQQKYKGYQSSEEQRTLLALINQAAVQELQDFLFQHPEILAEKYGPFQLTCLFIAVKMQDKSRRIAVVRALLELGADVNTRNKVGQTPLFYAAARLDLQSCKLLLQAGADPNIKDEFEKAPLEYAQELGRQKNAEIIDFYSKLHAAKQAQQTTDNSPADKNQKNIPKPRLIYAPCYISESGKVNYMTAEEKDRFMQDKTQVVKMMRNPKLLEKCKMEVTQNWRRVGLKIVDRLMASNESVWFKHLSQIWRVPQLGPDSPGVDLTLIRKKLEHHVYNNPKQLREDINSIWVNTKQRLGDFHETTQHALELCTTFQHLAREYHYNAYID